ncbi:ABC transporter ATP-binding protein [Cellulomonas soli]|uniref:ABC transporter ATP-binding protein n=1 Tax=Cellulomonas soli TaxID=931535 RepID=UPI003F84963D
MRGADVLEVNDLVVRYGHGPRAVHAVDGVSLTVPRGGVVGVVGESGSGKSTLARAIVGMAPVHAGTIAVDDHDMTRRGRTGARARASMVQMVFQDPYSSLNPRMRVGEAIAEVLAVHSAVPASGRAEAVRELLELVRLDPDVARQHPRQISGGMRQRVAIARVLAVRPRLIVADEITSALDASVQGVVLNLMRELQTELGLSMLFISHNLAAVRYMAQEVVVMHRGKVVEHGPTEQVVATPGHPYTQGLISALPRIEDAGRDVLLGDGLHAP